MNEEQAAWLGKARDNLRAARLLLENGFSETAVSRAFYAMFYAAKALLAQIAPELSSHGAVIGAFGKEFAKTKRLDPELHRYLLDAFERRQRADYDYFAEIPPQEAEEQIRRAEEFLNAAEVYLTDSEEAPPRSAQET